MNTLRLARVSWGADGARARLVRAAMVCGAILLALAAAYGPLGWGIERVTVLVLAAPVFAAALNWRRGICIVLAYVIVEGAVMNLLYPSLVGLFIKDALVMCAYAAFAASLFLRREAWRAGTTPWRAACSRKFGWRRTVPTSPAWFWRWTRSAATRPFFCPIPIGW